MRPPLLQPNDKIALVAPARRITYEEIAFSLNIFRSWGLQPIYDERLFKVDNQFGGTDKERAEYLKWALDSPDVKAVICVRGGYGITRIIDDIDFTRFRNNPKWVCGYSDVTALLAHIHNMDIESIHCTMPMLFQRDSPDSIGSIQELLFGENSSIVSPPHELNIHGVAEGKLIGGNLSILNTIIGTPSDIEYENSILFIEDIDEYLYNIDRMMVHLKRAGKFKSLVGVIVGHMTDMKDNSVPFGRSANEIVLSHLKDKEIPVCFGFPIGHEQANLAVPIGRFARLEVTREVAQLFYPLGQ